MSSSPTNPDLSDPALIDRLRSGDPSAFELLVRATSGRMLAVARRFMRREEEAMDAVQDAFIQAFKALPTFEGRAALPTWMHSITVRACLMKLRAKKSRPEISVEDLLPTFKKDGHREEVGPKWVESDELGTDEKAIIRNCIDKLPEDFRHVVLLRDIEELDTREAADALGISEDLVKTRLHRARQALRTLLDPYFRKKP